MMHGHTYTNLNKLDFIFRYPKEKINSNAFKIIYNIKKIICWVEEVFIVKFVWVRVAYSATIKLEVNTVPPFCIWFLSFPIIAPYCLLKQYLYILIHLYYPEMQ